MPTVGPTVSQIQLIEAYTESSFANDESSNLGSFTPIPLQEGSAEVTLTQEMHDPMQLVQNQLQYREEILGKKACQIQFTMPFAPTGTAAGQGTTAIQGALGLLLTTVLGGETLDAGTTVSTSWSTAGGGNVSTGSVLNRGNAVGWVNSSSKLEARPMYRVVGDALTLGVRFSTAPVTSDVIYGSASYYMSQDPDTSLNFAVRGLEADDGWLLMGCQLDSMSLNLPLDGTIPTIQFTFKGVNWLNEDDTTAGDFSLITSSGNQASYTGFDPIVGHEGDFLYATATTDPITPTTVHVSSVGFEPQVAYTAITSPSGTNGVYRWRLTRSAPVLQGEFTTFYEDDTWMDKRDNRDDLQFLYQIGTTAGETILIEASTCQVTDVQKSESDDGISGLTVSWKGRVDETRYQASSGDSTGSPLKIHFL